MPIRRLHLTLCSAGITLALGTTACAPTSSLNPVPSPSSLAAPHVEARVLSGTGSAIGSVALRETNGGVDIRVTAVGLTPGDHGVHLHASPLCEGPAFQTAGGHLNPGAKQHGHQNPAGPHLGDLGNLPAGADGSAVATFTVAGTTIRMLLGRAGIALLIHAAPDDEKTDPSGGSGARVGCAVLREGATNSSPSSS